MRIIPSRLLMALCLAACLSACNQAGYPPAQPQDLGALEAPVRRLVEQRSAAVTATPADALAHAKLGAVYQANGLPLPAAESFAQAAALDSSDPLWPYYQARAMRGLGRDEEARALLGRALEIDNGSAPAHLLLGWIQFDTGNVAEARTSFQHARNFAPDQPEPLIGLATLALDEGQPAEARDLAQAALDLRESSRHAKFVLGSALVALGDESRGRAEMNAGADSSSSNMQTPFSILIVNSRVNRADTLSDAAKHSERGRHAKALAMLDALLKDYPRDPLVHSNRGSVLEALGRDEEASQSYLAALQLDDQLWRTWKNLAVLHMRLGNLPGARDAAQHAIALDDEVVEAHGVLAIVLRRDGDLTGAMRAARRAIELQPQEASYHAALGNIYAVAGQNAPAVSCYEHAIELDPEQPQLQLSLASSLIGLARYDEAQAAINRARALDPTLPGLTPITQKLARESGR